MPSTKDPEMLTIVSTYRLQDSHPHNPMLVPFLPEIPDDHRSLASRVLQDIVQILHLEGNVLHEVPMVPHFGGQLGLLRLVLRLEDEDYLKIKVFY